LIEKTVKEYVCGDKSFTWFVICIILAYLSPGLLYLILGVMDLAILFLIMSGIIFGMWFIPIPIIILNNRR